MEYNLQQIASVCELNTVFFPKTDYIQNKIEYLQIQTQAHNMCVCMCARMCL